MKFIMDRGFLLKTFFLVILLALVLAVIIGTVGINLGGDKAKSPGTQTFFEQFVVAGGPIVWFVLLPMSLIMVYLTVEHGLIIRRSRLLPDAIGSRIVAIIRRFGPGRLEAKVSESDDLVSKAIVNAVTKAKTDWFRMRSLISESLQDQASVLLRKIEWLSIIGNVSPMVGLFGTVFGMIKLFNAIVTTGGQPQPAQLAEGISIALVTTFWGLFIAIPALAMYGIFRNRIETLVSDAVVEAENIMPEIRHHLKKHQLSKSGKTGQPGQPIRELAGRASKKISESVKPL